MPPSGFRFGESYAHLREDGGVSPLEVTPAFWEDLAAGRPALGPGRLVSHHRFDADWSSWEVHPAGDELVCLLEGAADFVLEVDGEEQVVPLRGCGAFLIVPAGVWHTVRVAEPTAALFLTAGEGTEHRPA
jgi:mannose-6-phosphate isomerase-like protein (cupin superfamily)